MWGAIIGDLAGSIYEGDQIDGIHPVSVKKLIDDKSFYSDDTILTIAILDAYLSDKDYEGKLKEYVKNYKDTKHPMFESPFSPGFIRWAEGKRDNNSIGNGAMMRISPIPYLANDYIEMITEVNNATRTSHDTDEAVDSASIISSIMFSSLHGVSKEDLINEYASHINFHPFNRFNATCYETLNNCLYALFSSKSFEEAIKKVLSYGGDTDTNACIVGAMAEALYGVPDELIEQAKEKLPNEFIELVEEAYNKNNSKVK